MNQPPPASPFGMVCILTSLAKSTELALLLSKKMSNLQVLSAVLRMTHAISVVPLPSKSPVAMPLYPNELPSSSEISHCGTEFLKYLLLTKYFHNVWRYWLGVSSIASLLVKMELNCW